MTNAIKDLYILKLFTEGKSKRHIMKECNVGMEKINQVILGGGITHQNIKGRPLKITQRLLDKIEEITF